MASTFSRSRISELTWKQAVADRVLEFVNENAALSFKIEDAYEFLYWLPVKRSVVDLAIESRLKLVESMAFVRLDF